MTCMQKWLWGGNTGVTLLGIRRMTTVILGEGRGAGGEERGGEIVTQQAVGL